MALFDSQAVATLDPPPSCHRLQTWSLRSRLLLLTKRWQGRSPPKTAASRHVGYRGAFLAGAQLREVP